MFKGKLFHHVVGPAKENTRLPIRRLEAGSVCKTKEYQSWEQSA